MRKHLPPKLLLIAPYFFVIYVLFIQKHADKFFGVWSIYLLFIAMGLIVVVNLVYPFVTARRRETSVSLLAWSRRLKLWHIVYYVLTFLFGFLITLFILPVGISLSILLAVFNYLLLLSTSMYGISGLLRARKERTITTGTTIIHIILHFFFCLDVISAVLMYRRVNRKGSLTG